MNAKKKIGIYHRFTYSLKRMVLQAKRVLTVSKESIGFISISIQRFLKKDGQE